MEARKNKAVQAMKENNVIKTTFYKLVEQYESTLKRSLYKRRNSSQYRVKLLKKYSLFVLGIHIYCQYLLSCNFITLIYCSHN